MNKSSNLVEEEIFKADAFPFPYPFSQLQALPFPLRALSTWMRGVQLTFSIFRLPVWHLSWLAYLWILNGETGIFGGHVAASSSISLAINLRKSSLYLVRGICYPVPGIWYLVTGICLLVDGQTPFQMPQNLSDWRRECASEWQFVSSILDTLQPSTLPP